jgi:ubiquinone/menaquinone biosynthesis C-methylase UbiE
MGNEPQLFNRISGVYGWFFNWQVNRFRAIFEDTQGSIDFSVYNSAVDVGCGTGALCKVLAEQGLSVTGIDPAEKMLAVARRKARASAGQKEKINFLYGNALKGLPFEDNSFDVGVSAYVAHGLKPEDRNILYREMRRIARDAVILFEYNENRSIITNIAETLEGGDYFIFIRVVKEELTEEFGNLKVIQTGKRSAIYICKLNKMHPVF